MTIHSEMSTQTEQLMSPIKQHVLCDIDLNGTYFADRTEDNTIDFPTKQVVCFMLPYMLADVDRDSAVDAFDLFRIDKRINGLV